MPNPNIVRSGLSQPITIDGQQIRIEIYRLESDPTWILELVDEAGTSVVWDDPYETDQQAFDEAIGAITDEGLALYAEPGNVVEFPQRMK